MSTLSRLSNYLRLVYLPRTREELLGIHDVWMNASSLAIYTHTSVDRYTQLRFPSLYKLMNLFQIYTDIRTDEYLCHAVRLHACISVSLRRFQEQTCSCCRARDWLSGDEPRDLP